MLKKMNNLNQHDPFVINVAEAIETDLNEQANVIGQLRQGNFFDTCSEAVLAIYEKEAGVKSESKELDDRRSSVMAKWLTSNVASLESIQQIADSWSYGKTDCSYADMVITVTFTDKGIPTGLEDLKAAIEEAKPAHLAVEYIVTYNTWEDVKAMTWSEVSGTTWEGLLVR